MKTANAALAKTPWGLLATGASMAIGLIIDLIKNTNKLSESQKRLNEIDQQYTGNLREQTGQMEMLMVQIRKTNPGTEERIKLVDRLNELIPNVVDKQTLYGASLQDLKNTKQSIVQNSRNVSACRLMKQNILNLFSSRWRLKKNS